MPDLSVRLADRLLLVLPALIAGALGLWIVMQEEYRRTTMTAQNLARGVATMVDVRLASYKGALRALASSHALVSAGDLAIVEREARLLGEEFGGWFLLGTAGKWLKLRLYSRAPPGTPLPDPYERAALPEVRQAELRSLAMGRPVFSDIFPGKLAKRPVVTAALPVRSAGGEELYLYFSFSAVHLDDLIQDHGTPKGVKVLLSDGAGTLIRAPRTAGAEMPQSLSDIYAKAIGTQTHGVVEDIRVTAGLEGGIVAYQRLRQAPDWTISVVHPVAPLWPSTPALWPFALSGITLWLSWLLLQRRRMARRQAQALARSQDESRKAAAMLADLRRQDEQKSRLMAVLSHEIRTPLTGMLGALEMMDQRSLSPEQSDYLDMAQRSGESLHVLLDDVLELARLGSGGFSLTPAPFRPDEILSDVAETIRQPAADQGNRVSVEITDPAPLLVGDAQRIRQVLLNFATNAVKFTQDGTIDCELHVLDRRDGRVRFEMAVRDSGIGIAAEDIPKLFTDFGMLEQARPLNKSGTGLGLAIARRLAHAMGGRILVDSTPGKGSRFALQLELAEADSLAPLPGHGGEHPATRANGRQPPAGSRGPNSAA